MTGFQQITKTWSTRRIAALALVLAGVGGLTILAAIGWRVFDEAPSREAATSVARQLGAGGLTFATLLELEKELEARFQFGRLEKALGGIVLGNVWQKQFGDGLRRSLREGRREKLTQIVADGNRVLPPRKWVVAYLEKHARMWHLYRESLHRMNEEKSQDLFPLAVVVGSGVASSAPTAPP